LIPEKRSSGSYGVLSMLATLTGLSLAAAPVHPNVVFLVVESTDGRTWRDGYAPVPIPTLRGLATNGTQFDKVYANTPVCCPSRATFWSGRHAHNIPHTQHGTNVSVNGAWNNFEGLPPGFDLKIGDVLGRAGYNVVISGKEDWSTGAHSMNVRLNSWTMYTQFPYSVNATGGWYDETDCPSDGDVGKDKKRERHSDWKVLNKTVKKLGKLADEQAKGGDVPFFVYQGMNIVHPPYETNEYWFERINISAVTVPSWEPLEELHPCDLQSSMLKGCTPSDSDAEAFYDKDRRRRIRAIYYAMIAEFDAMVGEYVATIYDAGVQDRTCFIVMSDHGDMNMEHQQFYKMVPYDASSRVPIIISAPWLKQGQVSHNPTQLIDVFPTIMDITQTPASLRPDVLDGTSLMPQLALGEELNGNRFVVSQFHGCNIAMSWFMCVGPRYKYIVYGTGKEVSAQLFDIESDPDETTNLVKKMPDVVTQMDAELRTVVDYPAVALDVATYNQLSFRAYVAANPSWQDKMDGPGLRWDKPFDNNKTASLLAIDEWLASPPQVRPCRSGLESVVGSP